MVYQSTKDTSFSEYYSVPTCSLFSSFPAFIPGGLSRHFFLRTRSAESAPAPDDPDDADDAGDADDSEQATKRPMLSRELYRMLRTMKKRRGARSSQALVQAGRTPIVLIEYE